MAEADIKSVDTANAVAKGTGKALWYCQLFARAARHR